VKQRFSKRTRLVSALVTLAMVFTFLPISAFAATDSYGPVYLDDRIVPDDTFREYLLKQFDKDHNGTLYPAERYAVTEIDVNDKNITSLKGIEFFPNLQKLSCWDNRLTSLDVSKNTELTYLKCSYNRLTELDVSKNTELTYLDCGYNRLTELDVSQNTKLTELYFVSNKITSLQADNCTNLTVIFTGSNKYKVEVYKKTRILDPSILPGNFDISRVRNLKGATQNADGTLTVQEGGGKVTYEYRCVGEIYKPFTLNVTETDDPNAGIVPPVTPPSGGDTPGGSTGGETGGGSTGGSTPGGPTGGETGGGSPGGGSTGGGDGGGAIVIVAAAGAAVAGVVGYGVYNCVSGQKLQALLPEGVAAPENRAQTALLLWNTAGRPEPADAPAFADVADPDTAKAAQWCVEQGLMKRRLNGKFAPGSSIPAYQVLNAYRKLAG